MHLRRGIHPSMVTCPDGFCCEAVLIGLRVSDCFALQLVSVVMTMMKKSMQIRSKKKVK